MFGDFLTCATKTEEVSKRCIYGQVMRLHEYFKAVTQPVARRQVQVLKMGRVASQKVTTGPTGKDRCDFELL